MSLEDIDNKTTPASVLSIRVTQASAVSMTKLFPSANVTELVPSKGRESDNASANGS